MSDMKTCKVKSVKYIGKEMAYNMTMAGNQHNYQIVDKEGHSVFSKNSHSCCYSAISYQCGYLKIYYPLEFMCNLLSSEIDNADKGEKLNSYIREAGRMNIPVLAANINKSKMKFTIEKSISSHTKKPIEVIRSPFTAIDGVGEVAAKMIVENQPYKDLKDFIAKIDGGKVNTRVFQAVLQAGAMDGVWNAKRGEILAAYENTKDEVKKEKNARKKQDAYLEEHGDPSMLWMGAEKSEIKL